MSAPYRLARGLLDETFRRFRECGCGRDECQALWLSPWSQPDIITKVVHPKHAAHFGGFVLDDAWLNDFWLELGRTKTGIRVQVHTHPGEAFHSPDRRRISDHPHARLPLPRDPELRARARGLR